MTVELISPIGTMRPMIRLKVVLRQKVARNSVSSKWPDSIFSRRDRQKLILIPIYTPICSPAFFISFFLSSILFFLFSIERSMSRLFFYCIM